ncbi:RNA polymerase subunit sigma [Rossellomorea vietnamensis]|uniref:RNA polymerase subunit sigma n=2 Tax=Rossellomorea vietnamensis TaxID=218284 RepID=A0A0P6W7R3_9BACI|nr:RNA polymerase subunit sigma [Rossellomorea vietnamensis]
MEQNEMSREETVEWLMDEYGKKVVRLAYTYLKQEQLAEDVAQEVFIRCYQKFDTFRQESSYQTWIYSITVNLCKDRLKSWSFRNLVFSDFFSSKGISHHTPESSVLHLEAKTELSQSVLGLPIKYREIMILFYYEELTYKEIEDLLGVSSQTIKSRLHRGRNMLRKKLKGGEGND